MTAAASSSSTGLGRADLLLGLGVFLARVPFLGPGYGADADAWRVAWTGMEIARRGVYQSSRAPGNPIPEFAAALLSGAPAWAFNALTALLGALAVVLFGAWLRRLGARVWLAGAVALAFTPVVAIHSADAMDYVWALAFVMAAVLAAHDGRALAAGLALGIATGCRLSSLVYVLPASVLVASAAAHGARSPVRAIATLWATTLASAGVAFAPVFAAGGFGVLHGYEHFYPAPLYVAKNMSVDVWGLPGSAALAAVALRALWRRGRASADPAVAPGAGAAPWVASALAVAVGLAVFLRLPHEGAYLVPIVPFVLALCARVLSRRSFAALAVVLMLSAFGCKVSEPGKPDSVPPTALSIPLGAGEHARRLDVLRGPVWHDHARRERGMRFATAVRDTARAQAGPAVVAAWEWLPVLRVMARGSTDGATRYVYVPLRAEFDSLRAAGVAVYDLPGAEDDAQLLYGYSLRAGGSRLLWPRGR